MQTNSNESDKQKLELLRAAAVRRAPKAPSAARSDAGQKGAPLGKSAKPRRASSADNAPAAEKRCQPSSGKYPGLKKFPQAARSFPKKAAAMGLAMNSVSKIAGE